MKNLIYLILISLTILSCSKNDDSPENPILGEWKLIKIISDDNYNPPILDYSNKNIIYNFTSHEIRYSTGSYESIITGYELIITGEENAGYPNGKYTYNFREDYPGPGPWAEDELKVLLVAINGAKYIYDLTDGVMTLGQSAINGGSDYIFKKVK